MMILLTLILLTTVLALALIGLALLLAAKGENTLEKASPFECGFYPQASFRSPFSIHFFLVSILFLIFDVELVLLFPLFLVPVAHLPSIFVFTGILVLLAGGVVVEWSQKMLDWANFK